MTDVNIRKASATNVTGIVQLWSDLQTVNSEHEPRLRPHRRGPEWYREYIEMQLEDSSAAVFVAVSSDTVIGFTFGQILNRPTLQDGRCGFVADLCVREEYRRQGVGSRLFGELKAWFGRRNVHALEVQVVTQNEQAQRFWSGLGFGEFMRTMRNDG